MYDSIDIREISSIDTNDLTNVILDIRDKYEYLFDHISNSINIPYTYLITIPQNYLSFDNKYYIYCDSGKKSKKLCDYLSNLGYRCVDLLGGYKKYIDDR